MLRRSKSPEEQLKVLVHLRQHLQERLKRASGAVFAEMEQSPVDGHKLANLTGQEEAYSEVQMYVIELQKLIHGEMEE